MADRGKVMRAKERTLRSLSTWLHNRRVVQTESSADSTDLDTEDSTQGGVTDDVVVKVELPWSMKEEAEAEAELSSACQRCSAVFLLPSSLQVHLQSFHGEGACTGSPVGSSPPHVCDNNNTDKVQGFHGTLWADTEGPKSADTPEGFVIKLEPPWSMKEEPQDEPPAVYSTVQPMSDNTSGSLLSLNTSHVCQRCSASFVLFSSLELHMVMFHGESLRDLCPAFSAYDRGGVEDHNDDGSAEKVADCSKGTALDRRGEEGGDDDLGDKTEPKKKNMNFICYICSKAFPQLYHLKRHIVVHSGEKLFFCDLCCKAFSTTDSLRRHKVTHLDEKPFICEICDKGFPQADELKRHRTVHTGQKPFVCDVCNKGFTLSAHLKSHKLSHTGTRPFVCDVCSKAFYRADELSRHKLVHTGDKAFTCDICSKVFTQVVHLQKHMSCHTLQKTFVCDVCDKGFFQAYCLTRHKKTHTGHKPFVCDVCNKGFVERFGLKKHKLIHAEQKPFTCDECGKGFTQSRDMNKHKLMHSGHKPFVCDVCSKGFFGAGNLKRHKMTHTGHSAFVCEVCNDIFFSPGDLKTHRLIHINLRPLVCELCTEVSAQADGLKTSHRNMTGEQLYRCPHYGSGDAEEDQSRGNDKSSTPRAPASSDKVLVWAHPI